MKNKHIETFETIYDVDVVIANSAVTLEELREEYTYSDGGELEDNNYEAVTCLCKNKKTGKYVILVWCRNVIIRKDENKILHYINTASHEALHVVIDLQYFSQQEIDPKGSNEYLAYAVGYFAERIYDIWTKK